ncbi:hypothetical protein ABIB25_001887 [Nakamurella sp. UYEF19]|uniref:VOC family protein n=1 Tax=Nakamurella sp. UYEF19 TaxID=1756392 RepID=UPI003396DD7F
MPEIEPRLDHLVYATPDLASTVALFQEDTGVSPAAGGRHLGRGTRNYLVGLGPRRYLEIIGPDLENPVAPEVGIPFGIRQLVAPALVTWAVRPDDIEVAAEASKKAGADFGRARPMSRRTPAGDLLTWRLASTVPLPLDGVVPFLIDWGTTRHPASDAGIPQLGLLEFALTHPETAAVQAVLDALDVRVALRQGAVGLRAVLETPRGQLVLD